MPAVETTGGPVDVEELGLTLIHEHFRAADEAGRFQFPHLYDDQAEWDVAISDANAVVSHGVKTVVEPSAMLLGSMVFPQSGAHGTLIALVGSGMLDRFPQLQLLMVECGAGWLAWVVDAMDQSLQKYGQWLTGLSLEQKPSEYVRRQMHVTFMDDAAAVNNRHLTGVEPLMWGSDYPHAEGTWPNTREAIDRTFAGVPDPDRAAMLGGTAAKLFGFKAPVAGGR